MHNYNLRKLPRRMNQLEASRAACQSHMQDDLQDPIALLPPLAAQHVLSHLDVTSLCNCSRVCKEWKAHVDSDTFWAPHCQLLWSTKVWVPERLRSMENKKLAYKLSLEDAKRTHITEEELCQFTWNFSFKYYVAGALFPLLQEAVQPLHRYFHRDRTMTAPKDDPLTFEETYVWDFRKSKDGRRGLFVQVNRYPSLEISRMTDWSWRMENMWVTFESNHKAGPNPGKAPRPAGASHVVEEEEVALLVAGLEAIAAMEEEGHLDPEP